MSAITLKEGSDMFGRMLVLIAVAIGPAMSTQALAQADTSLRTITTILHSQDRSIPGARPGQTIKAAGRQALSRISRPDLTPIRRANSRKPLKPA
jgi:hypothetical protein